MKRKINPRNLEECLEILDTMPGEPGVMRRWIYFHDKKKSRSFHDFMYQDTYAFRQLKTNK